MEQRKIPAPGEFYRHFKNKLYQIVAVAVHSETGETMVVYQALYGDFKVWARPLSMFLEETDREKYPDVKQKYRFERVEPEKLFSGVQDVSFGEDGKQPGVPETGERPMDPHLLEFFDAMDARDYDKMAEALAKLSRTARKKEVDDICTVLEISPRGETVAEQIAGIRAHVRMLKKFDGERLR